MISVAEAQKLILDEIKVMGAERILLPNALGRTLCEDILSPLNHPPWNTSAMDGYAVRYTDTKTASRENPIRLKIIEEIPAGVLPQKTLGKGEAAKIMTGAPLPQGADAVVMVEDTEKNGDRATIFEAPEQGEFIRFKGEGIRDGECILKKGIRIRSPEIAMMASVGKSVIPVFQQPKVAILSTGDELADLDEPRGPDKIIDSNGYGLSAQVVETGGVPINLGIAKDNKDHLMNTMKAGLSADFLLISGGVSMGDYDFVIEVLEALNVTMKFWKVAMKPGQPLAFGTRGTQPICGLPGNPVSSMVSFEQFVRPAILKASGRTEILRPVMTAVLEEELKKHPGRQQFVRSIVSVKNGEYRVRSTGNQGSAIMKSLVKANAFMILPAEAELIKAGDKVQVQLLSEIATSSED
ncbi:molybdopterin molybdotransferase MoeA [Nitrospira defluvii]|nr:molybdopterin molybdotransferase MoeA [Nitrospira defluvii]